MGITHHWLSVPAASWSKAYWLKLSLITLSFAMQVPAIVRRFADLEGAANTAAYAVLLGVCWAAVIAAAHIRSTAMRWIWAIALAAGGALLYGFAIASQQFMTYDAFINMVNSTGSIGDSWDQQRNAYLAALLLSLATLFGIGLRPPMRENRFQKIIFCVPILVLVAVTAMIFFRGGDGGRALPSGIVGSAYSILFIYENVTDQTGPRKEVWIEPAASTKYRNIVMLVDESIAPAYLDINAKNGVKTPFSTSHENVSMHNFGIAASVTGCSVGSNVTLRHGGARDAYQEYNASYPSIWAYAKKAGLRTIYMDGQRSGGSLQNLMDEAERALIDDFIQFDDVAIVNRDMAIEAKLSELMADPAPKLILVNKIGAHFPVAAKYPEDRAHYTPALRRKASDNISDTGKRTGFDGKPKDWRLYRNSYRNTLRWNVAEFFDRLLEKADFSDSLLIYTSDHGQNLHEDRSSGLTTHCTPQPPMQEGAVPLVVLTGPQGDQWARWADANHDRSSHYMLFPTLLGAMGYSAKDIEPIYGTGLQQPSNDPMTFNTLFNARLNRDPQWMVVDPKALPQPPDND